MKKDLIVKGKQIKPLTNVVFKSDSKLEKSRSIRAIAASGRADRTGDIIELDGIGLTNFQANPVILFGHDHSSLPIGRATKVEHTNGKLMIDIQFATKDEYGFADTVYQLIKGGYLNALSIGAQVLEAEWMIDEEDRVVGRHFKKLDLLEVSVVPVPADAKALITTIKAYGAMSSTAEEYLLKTLEELPIETPALESEVAETKELVEQLWKTFAEPKVDKVEKETHVEDAVTQEEKDALLKRLGELEVKVAEQKQLGDAAQKFVGMMEMTVKALLTQAATKGLDPKTMMETVKSVAATQGGAESVQMKAMLASVESMLGVFSTSGK